MMWWLDKWLIGLAARHKARVDAREVRRNRQWWQQYQAEREKRS
jgi:hypothetical protein